jgi:hypothetical protein
MARLERQSFRRPALLLACALATGFSCGSVATAATDPGVRPAGAEERSERAALEKLLGRFPIGTQTVKTSPDPQATKPRTAISRSKEATTVSEPGDAPVVTERLWLAFIVGASVLFLLAATGAWAVRHRRREPKTSSVSASTLALFQQTLAFTPIERGFHVTELSQDRNSRPPAQAEPQREQADPQTDRAEAIGEHDYTAVGDRVIGILEAAEVAAAQIRADAADVAAEIRKAAEAEASVSLERANEEAMKIRGDAEAIAESIEAKRRSEVEELVRAELADAETQARVTRETAEENARYIETAARERADVLSAQVQPLEENMRRALAAFRGISAELEELLEAERDEPEESLVEALSASAKG